MQLRHRHQALKAIYWAETVELALQRLEEFEAEWCKRYPAIGAAWRRAWEYVVPFCAFAPGIRKMIHHQCGRGASLRTVIKSTAASPMTMGRWRWRRSVEWTTVMSQFAIQFGERFPGTTR
jgi:putative transposase